MLDYAFMRHAFVAAFVVACVAGVIGYFLVLRGQSFAGHALSHVGFTGATGAVLVGLPPLLGLVAITIMGGLMMGRLGERLAQRDVAIGMVLSLSLGLGLLFLHFYTAYANQAAALLFGNVLGVDSRMLIWLTALSTLCLAGLACLSRNLLFATLQPEIAEAKGVPVRLVSTLFLGLVGLATAEASTIVGVLLVFTLMVAPAATAQRLTARLGAGIALSAGLALVEAWGGIALAYETDWPSSVWITALAAGFYGASFVTTRSIAVLRRGGKNHSYP